MTDRQSKPNDPQISLIEAVYNRRSVRGYLDREIPEASLQRIFEIAHQAPSNCNVQPWQVYVAKGDLKTQLSQKMTTWIIEGRPFRPDYPSREPFVGPHRRRQVECAVALYNNMGIARDDKEGRLWAVVRNFEFFDAPYMAFIGMHKTFGATVALDVGMFAQNLMLALVAFGLHSCSMGTMRQYPDLVREAFGISTDISILFGIGFGYEDPAVPANRTRTTRTEVWDNVMISDTWAK